LSLSNFILLLDIFILNFCFFYVTIDNLFSHLNLFRRLSLFLDFLFESLYFLLLDTNCILLWISDTLYLIQFSTELVLVNFELIDVELFIIELSRDQLLLTSLSLLINVVELKFVQIYFFQVGLVLIFIFFWYLFSQEKGLLCQRDDGGVLWVDRWRVFLLLRLLRRLNFKMI